MVETPPAEHPERRACYNKAHQGMRDISQKLYKQEKIFLKSIPG
jgi:hypothetical protein